MDIGTKLRKLRKEKGITQKVIADFLGVKVNSYSQYENNVRTPNIDTLERIASFYDISGISFFMNNTENNSFDDLSVFLDHYFHLIREINELYAEVILLDKSSSQEEPYSEYHMIMSKMLKIYEEISMIENLILDESNLSEISNMIENYIS